VSVSSGSGREMNCFGVTNGNERVPIIVYDSAQECLEAYLGCPLEQAGSMEGYNSKGIRYSYSPEEALERIKKKRCWGFCSDKEALHLWKDESCDVGTFIELIAHERGHMCRPHHRSQDLEEIKANQYGEIARFAYEVGLHVQECYAAKAES